MDSEWFQSLIGTFVTSAPKRQQQIVQFQSLIGTFVTYYGFEHTLMSIVSIPYRNIRNAKKYTGQKRWYTVSIPYRNIRNKTASGENITIKSFNPL